MIHVDPEFAALIPPLTSEELAGLEASLQTEGCRDALVVWRKHKILLDGHNRKSICDRFGISYRTKEIPVKDRLDAMIWIRTNQASRRNLTDSQRAMNAAMLAELEIEKSKRDRASKGTPAREARKHETTLAHTSDAKVVEPKDRQPRAEEKAAKTAKVSVRKVKQAIAVYKADPGLAKKVQDGEVSLAQATREIKRKDIIEHLESVSVQEVKAIKGVYDVIVIDPPWPMEKIERDERPNQSEFDYPTMALEEISSLHIPSADDCHLWLWTTHRFLPSSFELLNEWDLKYVCAFVWHKPGGFQPIGLPQYNCEFALYARKGSPKFIDTKAFPVCFTAPRGKHSEKPMEFYETITRVTAGRRLDMFARKSISGFDSWGKEAS